VVRQIEVEIPALAGVHGNALAVEIELDCVAGEQRNVQARHAVLEAQAVVAVLADMAAAGEAQQAHRLQRTVEALQRVAQVRTKAKQRGVGIGCGGDRVRIEPGTVTTHGAQGDAGPATIMIISVEMAEPLIRPDLRQIGQQTGHIEMQR